MRAMCFVLIATSMRPGAKVATEKEVDLCLCARLHLCVCVFRICNLVCVCVCVCRLRNGKTEWKERYLNAFVPRASVLTDVSKRQI